MWIAVFIILLYSVVDVNYMLHFLATYLYSLLFRSKLKLLETSELYGVCLLTDVDLNLNHMNNCKYLRELEFGKIDLLARTGCLNPLEFLRNGTPAMIAGTILRYRFSIPVFTRFKVVTCIKWWDSKSIYIEQKIVTLADEVVRSNCYCKMSFLRDTELQKLVKDTKRPEIIPSELLAYLEANDSIELVQQQLDRNLKNSKQL